LAKVVEVIGLEGIPLIRSGDDLAEVIVKASQEEGIELKDGDVIVVSQKIVSKAEGRIVKLRDVKPSPEDERLADEVGKDPRLVKLIRKESKQMLKSPLGVLVTEDERGMICVNAGVDKSNVEGEDSYALLPLNPDESAERLRKKIKRLTGVSVAVIICDTSSRPFRRGQVNFAIGLSGMTPFKDYRGERDLFDYVLKVKNVAVADELAAAAELVIGQGREGTPVAIIRNVERLKTSGGHSARELFISRKEDMFSFMF